MNNNEVTIEEYKNFVQITRLSKSGRVFGNSNREHAVVLCAEILQSAEDGSAVRMYSGKLDKKHMASIELALMDALKRKCKVRILVDSKDETSWFSDFCKRYKADTEALSRLHVAQNTITDLPEEFGHFMTAGDDSHSFRYEEQHDETAQEVKAVASFNRPDIGEGMATVFDKMWKRRDPIVAA